jgi:hypothetical protein
MFSYPKLKLARKLVILSVMLVGLFVLTARNNVSAQPCCDSCDPTYSACLDYCYSGQIKDWMVPACLADCDTHYNWCIGHCSMCNP